MWTPSGPFTLGYRPVESHRLSTSTTELTHLVLAAAVLTLDFALLGTEFNYAHRFQGVEVSQVIDWLPFGAAAALTGFAAHELAHKVAAQSHGFWAEFRMSPFGLIFSLLTALTIGVTFAAPGATMIGGMGDTREWGRTSLAGPATNLVFSGGFALAAEIVLDLGLARSAAVALVLLAFINAWFSTFNLLPFGPLDGRKVLRWSRWIWAGAIALSAVVAIATFLAALEVNA